MVYTRLFSRQRASGLLKRMNRKSRERMFTRLAEEQRVTQIKVEVQQKKERMKAKYSRYPDGELWICIGGQERRVMPGEEPQEDDEIEDKEDNVATEVATPVDHTEPSAPPRKRDFPQPPPTSNLSNPIDSNTLRTRLQGLASGVGSQEGEDDNESDSSSSSEAVSDQDSLPQLTQQPIEPSTPPPRPPRSPLRPRSPAPLLPSLPSLPQHPFVPVTKSPEPPLQSHNTQDTAASLSSQTGFSVPPQLPPSSAFTPQPTFTSEPRPSTSVVYTTSIFSPSPSIDFTRSALSAFMAQSSLTVAPHSAVAQANISVFDSPPPMRVETTSFSQMPANSAVQSSSVAFIPPSFLPPFTFVHEHSMSQSSFSHLPRQDERPPSDLYRHIPTPVFSFNLYIPPFTPKVVRRKQLTKKSRDTAPRHLPVYVSRSLQDRSPRQRLPVVSSTRRHRSAAFTFFLRYRHRTLDRQLKGIRASPTLYLSVSLRRLSERLQWEKQMRARSWEVISDRKEKQQRQQLISVAMHDDFPEVSFTAPIVTSSPPSSTFQHTIPSVPVTSTYHLYPSMARTPEETSSVLAPLTRLSTPPVKEASTVSTSSELTLSNQPMISLVPSRVTPPAPADFAIAIPSRSTPPTSTYISYKPAAHPSDDDVFMEILVDRLSERLLEKMKGSLMVAEGNIPPDVKRHAENAIERSGRTSDKGKGKAVEVPMDDIFTTRNLRTPRHGPRVTVEDVPEEDELPRRRISSRTSKPTPSSSQSSRNVDPPSPPFLNSPACETSSSPSPSPAWSLPPLLASSQSEASESSSTAPHKASRRLSHWAPQRWSPHSVPRRTSPSGGFSIKRTPKQWTIEEDEEIIARFRRNKPLEIKVPPPKVDVAVDATVSTSADSSSDDGSWNSSEDEESSGYSSSPPPTPGHFIVHQPLRKRDASQSDSPSLCTNLVPVVGILGSLLLFSAFS